MKKTVKYILTIPIRILATIIYTIILPMTMLLDIIYGDDVINNVLETYYIIWTE